MTQYPGHYVSLPVEVEGVTDAGYVVCRERGAASDWWEVRCLDLDADNPRRVAIVEYLRRVLVGHDAVTARIPTWTYCLAAHGHVRQFYAGTLDAVRNPLVGDVFIESRSVVELLESQGFGE